MSYSTRPEKLYSFTNRDELRKWFINSSSNLTEAWVEVNLTKTKKPNTITYLELVEECLCFGWIDSIGKSWIEGKVHQRISPRRKNSSWTELNKERVRRLEQLGLMTERGRAVLPDMREEAFSIHPEIKAWLDENKEAAQFFYSCPKLYQRVKIDNIQSKVKQKDVFARRFATFKEKTSKKEMYGAWNDSGKLGT